MSTLQSIRHEDDDDDDNQKSKTKTLVKYAEHKNLSTAVVPCAILPARIKL